MEENGAGKDGESQRKKREEIEKNGIGWKKTERGEPTGSPSTRVTAVSGHR